jgi:hypothetical protein
MVDFCKFEFRLKDEIDRNFKLNHHDGNTGYCI